MALISFILLLVSMDYCSAQLSGPLRVQPQGIREFSLQDARYYRYLNIQGNTLYIGAMNYVIWLNAADISQKTSMYATTNLGNGSQFQNLQNSCLATYPSGEEYRCQNHIKSIIPLDDNNVEVCGTGAYSPKLMILNNDNITGTPDDLYFYSMRGLGICPLNPDDSYSVIYIKNHVRYSADRKSVV